MKRALIAFLCIVLLCSASACSAKPSAGDLHNTRLGVDVSLGSSKDDIDEALGEAEYDGDYFYYIDYDLTVIFSEGKAAMLTVDENGWTFMDKIHVGMEYSDVVNIYGEFDDYKTGTFMFDKDSKQVFDRDAAAYIILIFFESGKVDYFSLTTLNQVRHG